MVRQVIGQGRSGVAVGVLLQPEGVHLHGGAAAIGRAAQDTVARAVVDVEVDGVGVCIPIDEVIEQIVGQDRCGASGVVVEIIIYSLHG